MGSLSPAPLFLISLKPVRGQPPLSVGGLHDNVMLVAVPVTRDGAGGADGATQACTERRSDSWEFPLKLTATTLNWYIAPIVSPVA